MPLISSVGAVKSSLNAARQRERTGSLHAVEGEPGPGGGIGALGGMAGGTGLVDDLFERIPPEGSIVKQGIVEKAGLHGSWLQRRLFLSKDMLCYAYLEGEGALNAVRLVDVKHVSSSGGGTSIKPKSRLGVRKFLGLEQEQSISVKLFEADKVDGSSPSIWSIVHGSNDNTQQNLIFKCENDDDRREWELAVQRGVDEAQKNAKRLQERTQLEKTQKWIHKLYSSTWFQIIIVVMIIANFIANIIEAEIVPEPGSSEEKDFRILDYSFTALFTLDLLLNMSANFFYAFWQDNWNIMDFFIVVVSLVGLGFENVPGVKVIRVFRAFRVVRIFKRLRSLRLIVIAFGASLKPVGNTCFVLLMATAVWAILGVGLYRDRNPDMFGTFSKAFFTMFQCVTGDGWASQIARPMFLEREDHFDREVAAFFMSYVLVVMIVVVNVVLAVLLDEFLRAAAVEKAEMSYQEHIRTDITNPLDPLYMHLSKYVDSEDLVRRLDDLFRFLDTDEDGAIGYSLMAAGLRRLRMDPPIQLSEDDFQEILHGSGLPYASLQDGKLSPAQFHLAMRKQLGFFVERNASRELDWDPTLLQGQNVHLYATKYLITAVDSLTRSMIALEAACGGRHTATELEHPSALSPGAISSAHFGSSSGWAFPAPSGSRHGSRAGSREGSFKLGGGAARPSTRPVDARVDSKPEEGREGDRARVLPQVDPLAGAEGTPSLVDGEGEEPKDHASGSMRAGVSFGEEVRSSPSEAASSAVRPAPAATPSAQVKGGAGLTDANGETGQAEGGGRRGGWMRVAGGRQPGSPPKAWYAAGAAGSSVEGWRIGGGEAMEDPSAVAANGGRVVGGVGGAESRRVEATAGRGGGVSHDESAKAQWAQGRTRVLEPDANMWRGEEEEEEEEEEDRCDDGRAQEPAELLKQREEQVLEVREEASATPHKVLRLRAEAAEERERKEAGQGGGRQRGRDVSAARRGGGGAGRRGAAVRTKSARERGDGMDRDGEASTGIALLRSGPSPPRTEPPISPADPAHGLPTVTQARSLSSAAVPESEPLEKRKAPQEAIDAVPGKALAATPERSERQGAAGANKTPRDGGHGPRDSQVETRPAERTQAMALSGHRDSPPTRGEGLGREERTFWNAGGPHLLNLNSSGRVALSKPAHSESPEGGNGLKRWPDDRQRDGIRPNAGDEAELPVSLEAPCAPQGLRSGRSNGQGAFHSLAGGHVEGASRSHLQGAAAPAGGLGLGSEQINTVMSRRARPLLADGAGRADSSEGPGQVRQGGTPGRPVVHLSSRPDKLQLP